MKIAVFSDSHGVVDKMTGALRVWRPDLIVHLGDYARDAQALKKEFPQTPLKAVRGNCDFGSYERESECFLAGPVRVLITHGHRYGVKRGLDTLADAARFFGADLVLYGHTHMADCRQVGGIRLINPGTAGQGGRLSYARLEIGGDGSVVCNIVDLQA